MYGFLILTYAHLDKNAFQKDSPWKDGIRTFFKPQLSKISCDKSFFIQVILSSQGSELFWGKLTSSSACFPAVDEAKMK